MVLGVSLFCPGWVPVVHGWTKETYTTKSSLYDQIKCGRQQNFLKSLQAPSGGYCLGVLK